MLSNVTVFEQRDATRERDVAQLAHQSEVLIVHGDAHGLAVVRSGLENRICGLRVRPGWRYGCRCATGRLRANDAGAAQNRNGQNISGKHEHCVALLWS